VQISSSIEEEIRREKLSLAKLLANWPTYDIRLIEREKQLQDASLSSHASSTSMILGTSEMNRFKHFLPLVHLAFEVWIEKTSSSSISHHVDEQVMLSICGPVKQYTTLLLMTLLDWISPNIHRAAELVENTNFWHFEHLIQMIHDILTWPCSSYILQWCRWINMEEECIEGRIGRVLDFLLQLSSPLSDPLIHMSIQTLAYDCASLSRPTYLEELDAIGNEESGSSFFKLQLQRPHSEISYNDPISNGFHMDVVPHVETLPIPQLSSPTNLSWISLGSYQSTLPFIQFLLQDVLIGDSLFHTPISATIQTLSNLRSTFNESPISFITNLIISFLNIEKQQSKDSIQWYRSRCGLAFLLPKLLKNLLNFHGNLKNLLPLPPPSFVSTPQQILMSSIMNIINNHESALLRVMIHGDQDENGGMNLSAQVSLLPILLSILGHSHLLSFQNLQLLMQTTARDDIRVLLEDSQTQNWTFSLPSSDGLPPSIHPDISSLLQSFKTNSTLSDFTTTIQSLTQTICDASPKIDQIALILLDFIQSGDAESELICDIDNMGGGGNNGEEKTVFPTTKLGVLFEYLCYSPVMDMLIMVIPVWEWLEPCLQMLHRQGEMNFENDQSLGEISFANFSAILLFVLHLLSLTHSLTDPSSKQKTIDIIRQFALNRLDRSSYDNRNVHINGWNDFDDNDNDDNHRTPTSNTLLFLYSILIEKHEFVPNHAIIERMMSILLNSNPTSEILAFSPWTWVIYAPHLVDSCINFMSIRGANDERYDLIGPVVEGIHGLTMIIPCLRPIILHHLSSQHLFGVGDMNNMIHGSYLPVTIAEMIMRWILLTQGGTQGDMLQYARVVCISFCRGVLWKLMETDVTMRDSEWGPSLIPLVVETNQIDDSMIPIQSGKVNEMQEKDDNSLEKKDSKFESRVNYVLSQIINRGEEDDSMKNWTTILANISQSSDIMEVMKIVIRRIEIEIGFGSESMDLKAKTNDRKTRLEVEKENIETLDRRRRIMKTIQILAYTLANHIYAPSSTHLNNSVIILLEDLLPSALQRIHSTDAMTYFAFFSFCVLLSSKPIQRGVVYDHSLQCFTYHNPNLTSSNQPTNPEPISQSDYDCLQAIFHFYELILDLLSKKWGNKNAKMDSTNVTMTSQSLTQTTALSHSITLLNPATSSTTTTTNDPLTTNWSPQGNSLFQGFALSFLQFASSTPGLLSLFPSITSIITETMVMHGSSSMAIQVSLGELATLAEINPTSSLSMPSPLTSSHTFQCLTLWKVLCEHNRLTPTAESTQNPTSYKQAAFPAAALLLLDSTRTIDVIRLPSHSTM
jgi:hypothetical protein